MRNRQFVFAPKIEYEMAAERSAVPVRSFTRRREANQNRLQFPTWCRWSDSNRQALRHTILSRACIPFHHNRQIDHYL